MAKKKAAGGRPSLFGPKIKNSTYRVQGLLTVKGTLEFDRCRKHLAKLANRPMGWVSDADVIEWLARDKPIV